MGIFDQEIKLIQDIEDEIDFVVKRTVEHFGFVILDYVRNKQMDQKGEDGKGKKIKPDYSLGYSRFRISKGLQVDHVDLHFSGKFHATLIIEAHSDHFRIASTVDYADDIEARSGSDLLIVQEKYLKEFVENYLYPAIKKMIYDKFSKS